MFIFYRNNDDKKRIFRFIRKDNERMLTIQMEYKDPGDKIWDIWTPITINPGYQMPRPIAKNEGFVDPYHSEKPLEFLMDKGYMVPTGDILVYKNDYVYPLCRFSDYFLEKVCEKTV